MEFERGISNSTDKNEIIVELSRFTGHDLGALAEKNARFLS